MTCEFLNWVEELAGRRISTATSIRLIYESMTNIGTCRGKTQKSTQLWVLKENTFLWRGALVLSFLIALLLWWELVFWGHSLQKVGYITSCENLFRDIQAITGAIAVRVPT